MKNAGPREMSRTAWEERADEPADAVEHLVVPDPKGGEALGDLERPWPRHLRCP